MAKLKRLSAEDLARTVACIEGRGAGECGEVWRACTCGAYLCQGHAKDHAAACVPSSGPAAVLGPARDGVSR